MRRLGLATVIACGCQADPDIGDRTGECLVDAPPMLRVGRVEDGEFREFDGDETLVPIPSPQGGYGIVLHLQTEGLGPGADHFIDIEINTLLDGETMGAFNLFNAPLSCEGEVPGAFGAMLISFDQSRYLTPADLAALDGVMLELHAEVVDADGVDASTVSTVHIAAPD